LESIKNLNPLRRDDERKSMSFKRHLILLPMLVAIGVFAAGLSIARAEGGDDGSGDPTATCQSSENDQGEDVNDQGEDVQGSDQGDELDGTEADDQLDGNGGDDDIQGEDGNDDICGDQGDDVLNGGPGDDVIKGGPGDDTENGQAGDDDVIGNADDDTLTGGPGQDVVRGKGGNDKINVRHHGRDKVSCGRGHDVVRASRNDKVAANCEVVKR
jgi:Ca2+-binding RTX toxin-like protein